MESEVASDALPPYSVHCVLQLVLCFAHSAAYIVLCYMYSVHHVVCQQIGQRQSETECLYGTDLIVS